MLHRERTLPPACIYPVDDRTLFVSMKEEGKNGSD